MKPYNRREQAIITAIVLAAIVLIAMALNEINGHAHQESIVPLLNKIIIGVILLVGVVVHYQRRDKLYLMQLYESSKMHETSLQKEVQREVKMREQFLNNTIGFLAADLNEDRVLQISEKLSYQKGMTYSEFIEFQKQNYVAAADRDYIESNLGTDKLLEAFNNGVHNIELEYQGYDENGDDIWRECGIQLEQEVESGHVIAYLVIKNIVADKQREFLLLEKANRDYLTGLYNRGGGQEEIDKFLENEEIERGQHHVFLILDLDDFKSLNDTFGHQTGDRALQEVANILSSHFREYDITCRLAGDEFVVLIKDLPLEIIPKNIGTLLRKMNLEYKRGEEIVHVSASAGLAVWPSHGNNFKELYKKADKALYYAKENGKNTYAVYHE